MTSFRLASFLVLSAFASLNSQAVTTPPAIFVFGDSLSDTGNAYGAGYESYTVPPAYTTGKFTDGSNTIPSTTVQGNWVEQFATRLRLAKPTPSIAGGGNYAYGGAVTGLTVVTKAVPGLKNQVATFLKTYANKAPATSVYVVWGGANDLFDASSASTVPSAGKTAITNLKYVITELAAHGATKIVWLDLPPLGNTPEGVETGYGATLNTATVTFRTSMLTTITQLQTAYPAIKITPVDVYSLFEQALAYPAGSGYTNVTTPSQGMAVNPDKYLFWDALHPTTVSHGNIAKLAFLAYTEKPQAITFPVIPAKLKTDAAFTLTATASSGLAVTYHLVSGPATVVGKTVKLTGVAGTVSIQATQIGNTVYAPASEVTNSFTVK